eukprot:432568_1
MSLMVFLLLIVTKAAVPPPYGKYGKNGCTHKTVQVGGYVAGGYQTAILMYPTQAINDKTTLPFLAFAHGMTCGGPETYNCSYSSYPLFWAEMCSYGYIIAAPMSCPNNYCQSFYKDVITTITTMSSKKTAIDPALQYADFSKIGVYGHSMGGAATVHVANNKSINLIAAAPMHPSVTADSDKHESANVIVPSIWFTGSADTNVPPQGVYNGYMQDPVLPKIFVETKGATHNSNTENEAPYVANWFDCMIKGDSNACSYFFTKNGANNVCTGGMPMTRCIVNGSLPI